MDKIIQLKPEEEILEVVHEDIVPRVHVFLFLFVWFVLPFFFLFPLFRIGWIGVIIFVTLLGSAVVVGYRSFLKWTHTLLVVTDMRVVDIEQRGLFDRIVTETPYTHIDEASYRVKGLIPTIFRFGDVHLKLSGSAADIEFRHIRNPARLHDLINDLCAQSQHEDRDVREKKLRTLAKSLTPDQLNELVGQVRKRERDEAIDDVFSDET